jgi:WD40 repeat protein
MCAGSEDNTFKLWSSAGSCLQTVELPGCVWAVTFTGNGDVVAGAADGCAYVFSSAAERQDPIEGERLQARIAERKANAAPADGAYHRTQAGDDSNTAALQKTAI